MCRTHKKLTQVISAPKKRHDSIFKKYRTRFIICTDVSSGNTQIPGIYPSCHETQNYSISSNKNFTHLFVIMTFLEETNKKIHRNERFMFRWKRIVFYEMLIWVQKRSNGFQVHRGGTVQTFECIQSIKYLGRNWSMGKYYSLPWIFWGEEYKCRTTGSKHFLSSLIYNS